MRQLKIKNHLWMRGGSVGIASDILEDIEVEVLTKTKDGNRMFPNRFIVTEEKLRSTPVERFARGVPVRVVRIPIEAKGGKHEENN